MYTKRIKLLSLKPVKLALRSYVDLVLGDNMEMPKIQAYTQYIKCTVLQHRSR